MSLNKVILTVLDGWGIAPPNPGNAIALAQPPFFNSLLTKYPNCQLEASGVGVGLPADQDGNTETGHLNIGAGRIVYQDLARINMSIADGSFFRNPALNQAIDHTKKNQSALHLLGLIGSSGVHAYNDHLYALLMLAAQHKLNKVYLHLITDGRDSSPNDAIVEIKNVLDKIHRYHVGQIATICGRYYAMDRDMRLDRTELAFQALVNGRAETFIDPITAIQQSYNNGVTDEFIKPILITDGSTNTRVKAGDALIFYNFRIDRPRQLTKMFVDAKIDNFKLVTMTKYHNNFDLPTAFPEIKIINPLGEVLANANLKQLHCSESEKERFVTYYFNGQNEQRPNGEDDLIVPSPKVATYDLQPQMSTPELIEQFSQKYSAADYQFAVLNIACPDMVAHTGNIEATKTAILAADNALKALADLADKTNSYLLITADHGNAEELINKLTGGVDTEHSTSPVPFIVYSSKLPLPNQLEPGVLADISPTILALIGLDQPLEMTGHNLLIYKNNV